MKKSPSERTNKICPICGKEIIYKGSNAQKYCSEKCRRIANRNTENIKKHQKTFWNRTEIYDHFHFRCAICGWEVPAETDGHGRFNNSHGCEIHHITPVEEGGGDGAGNLILLCPNCHKKADFGIISREDLSIILRRFDKDQQYFFENFNRLSVQDKTKALYYMDDLFRKEEEA